MVSGVLVVSCWTGIPRRTWSASYVLFTVLVLMFATLVALTKLPWQAALLSVIPSVSLVLRVLWGAAATAWGSSHVAVRAAGTWSVDAFRDNSFVTACCVLGSDSPPRRPRGTAAPTPQPSGML